MSLATPARYEWLYVYAFSRPKTGESFSVLLPRVKGERAGEALVAFAPSGDPSGAKVLVMLVDNGGQRRLACGQAAGRLTQCRVAPAPSLHARATAGRAVLGAGPRGGGEPSDGRMDRLRAILRGRLGYPADHPKIVQPVVGFR
jgi:hypothetical protein